jgi:hypothetical protein
MSSGKKFQSAVKLTAVLLCGALQYSCAGGTQRVSDDHGFPRLRLDSSQSQQGRIQPPPAAAQPVTLPPAAADALARIGLGGTAQQLDGTTAASGKDASIILPYNLPADQGYTAGGAGVFAMGNVDFPGPPLGGAQLQPAGSSFPDNFAYVIYRFDDILQPLASLELTFGFSLGAYGVAAYDFGYGTGGRWEPLYYGPFTGNISVSFDVPGAQWTNAGADLAVMLFCLDPAQLKVDSLLLQTSSGGGAYDEIEPNNSPAEAILLDLDFLDLHGNVGTGGPHDGGEYDYWYLFANAGDTVSFTLDYDSPGATLLLYILDNNLNELAMDTGDGDSAALSYTFDGSEPTPAYFVVANPFGSTPTDYWLDYEGPLGDVHYDEREPNNSLLDPQPLPLPDFTGFSGEIGVGGDYDGSDYDIYGFSTQAGDSYAFTVNYAEPLADIVIGLMDANFDVLTTANGDGAQAQLSYDFDGTENQPIVFVVQNLAPAPPTTYTLDCDGPALSGYDEVENNDDFGEVNPLTFPVVDFAGNVGEGGPYDGDMFDGYTFAASPGDTVRFTLRFNPAADWDQTGVIFGIVDQDFYDGQPDSLFRIYAGRGGVVDFEYTFDGTETAPFYLLMQHENNENPFPPATDYLINATSTP